MPENAGSHAYNAIIFLCSLFCFLIFFSFNMQHLTMLDADAYRANTPVFVAIKQRARSARKD